MKKLGFGLMRMPVLDKTNAADVDIEQVKKMVDLFMEKGFTYFDTALMYNAFASEGVAWTGSWFTIWVSEEAADRDRPIMAQIDEEYLEELQALSGDMDIEVRLAAE